MYEKRGARLDLTDFTKCGNYYWTTTQIPSNTKLKMTAVSNQTEKIVKDPVAAIMTIGQNVKKTRS